MHSDYSLPSYPLYPSEIYQPPLLPISPFPEICLLVLFCNPLSLTKTFHATTAWKPGAFTGGCTTEGKTQTTPDSFGNKQFNSEGEDPVIPASVHDWLLTSPFLCRSIVGNFSSCKSMVLLTRRWYFIAPSIASDSYIFFPPVLIQCSLSPGEKTMCVLFWTKCSSLILSSLNSQEFLYSLQFPKKRHLWLRLKVALSMDIKNTYTAWGYVNVHNSSGQFFLWPLTSRTCLFDRVYNRRN